MRLVEAVRRLRAPRFDSTYPQIDLDSSGDGDRLDAAVRRWTLGEREVEVFGPEFYVSPHGTLGIRLKSDALTAVLRGTDR